MDYTDKRESLEQFLIDNLKKKRYLHSMGVEKMATHLARIHGADVEKAAFAGRFHDIAKCFSQEKMDECVIRYSLSSEYLGNTALAHSKVGEAILRTEFGVYDEDVLRAVSSHTTGRDGMSLLEEIVYVSDAIEETRSYEGIEELRDQAENDLDGACLFIMDYTIDRIQSEERTLDTETLKARDFINDRILNKGERMNIKEIGYAVAHTLSEKKVRDIKVIDIGEKSSFADYFVNVTASSSRQVGALANIAEDKLAELGVIVKNTDGRPETGWILIDAGDIVINVFSIEARERYSLDKLWSDCETTTIED